MILPIIDDQGKVKEIQKALGVYSSKAPSVLANALNATATQVQKQIKKYIKQNYALSKEELPKLTGTKRMRIQRASTGRLSATIWVKSGSLHLTSFQVSPDEPSATNGRGTVKAKVMKSSTMEPIYGFEDSKRLETFIAKFRNGKTAVVHRVPGEPYKRELARREAIKYPRWGRKNDTTRLQAKFSNSYPMMAKKAFERSDGEINKILQEQINKRIAQTLAKEAAKASK